MTLTIFLPHTLSAAIIESIEDEQRSYGLEFSFLGELSL